MVIQLKVNGPKGEQMTLKVCDNKEEMKHMTVGELKQKIMQELRTGEEIRIVFRTETMEDSSLLMTYGVQHMSTIQTLLKLPGGD